MLDTDTKRRIDTARDILVGKLPDPKSQVEQITIALIYKFMDDMDSQSEELGGTRSFFADDFQKYGWARLMRGGLGGHEMLGLYSEAITRMPENPGIPPLFRDIFKNAYLPYRDPETLRAFLKIIDDFEYDHSERLGDAFEYLLSVLGSQGDAGQFRTPRHIIDFIVSILDPKKGERILDPACGTAGFLISAYKHILAANTDENGDSTLTPDDRERLATNFRGYDISPDMVRLSLVNMYLHGFADPQIHEYDTLSSQDRWNEHADVILANPPFMSPRGGIQPHNRFSVQSKRSEVLFVDYMAEHLTSGGRAGIIVPEGIIFQSQTAYKQLRKLLAEDSLVAVVSLPAGVFNPYSGVKTSILILDKTLAKQSTSIGFFKIHNDGFGLGAQRRTSEKNDLPHARAEIVEYLRRLRAREPVEDFTPTLGLVVSKEKVAANGDYNLSGERYREGIGPISAWPFVPVGDVFRKADKTVLPQSLKGPVTYLGLENITQNTGKLEGNLIADKPAEIKSLKNVFKPRHILYGKLRPNLNKVWLADRQGICSTDIFVVEALEGMTDPAVYAYLFRSARFNDAVMSQLKGAQLPRIGWSSFAELQIPLPPLVVQKEIVAEIEGYQKVIDGARTVLDNYRPHIPIHPDWPTVDLGDLIDILDSKRRPITKHDRRPGPYPYYGATGILDYVDAFLFDESLVLIGEDGAKWGPGERTAYGISGKTWVNNHAHVLRPKGERLLDAFLITAINGMDLSPYITGVTVPKLNQEKLRSIRIACPPLATQQSFVADIEAERGLVNANRELVARFNDKIEAVLTRVWGDTQSTADGTSAILDIEATA